MDGGTELAKIKLLLLKNKAMFANGFGIAKGQK